MFKGFKRSLAGNSRCARHLMDIHRVLKGSSSVVVVVAVVVVFELFGGSNGCSK